MNLRVWPVGFIDDLLKAVVRDNAQSIDRLYTRPPSIRQAQPASNRLFDQGAALAARSGMIV